MSPIGSTFCLLAAGSVDGDDPVDMLSEMDVNVDCNFRAIGLAELVNAKTPREQQSIMITSAACRNDGRWRLIVKEQINGKVYSVNKLSTENNELYGSVKPTEIAKLIKEENKLDIKPSMIQPVEEIKSLGKFKAKIFLHSEVDAEIIISVTSADTIQ